MGGGDVVTTVMCTVFELIVLRSLLLPILILAELSELEKIAKV